MVSQLVGFYRVDTTKKTIQVELVLRLKKKLQAWNVFVSATRLITCLEVRNNLSLNKYFEVWYSSACPDFKSVQDKNIVSSVKSACPAYAKSCHGIYFPLR